MWQAHWNRAKANPSRTHETPASPLQHFMTRPYPLATSLQQLVILLWHNCQGTTMEAADKGAVYQAHNKLAVLGVLEAIWLSGMLLTHTIKCCNIVCSHAPMASSTVHRKLRSASEPRTQRPYCPKSARTSSTSPVQHDGISASDPKGSQSL